MKSVFHNPTEGKLSLARVVDEITGFIQEDPEASYGLVIGTDSQSKKTKGESWVDFVTAIVIHRRGKGGRYFWQKSRKNKAFTLRHKIYTETLLSIETAKNFVPKLKTSLNGNGQYALEIHIDVGEVGPTREMIKEVVGIVRGNGLTPKIKPDAYGAATVADKHT
jgi:predicted RNase H-related nuclease YkuK (DUF458 family)